MSRWIVALVLLLAGLGLVMYQLFGKSEPAQVHVPTRDAGPAQIVAPADAAPYKVRQRGTDARPAAQETQLDPQSEEFSAQLDVGIPDRFRASLSRCPRQGFDPDAKISISYTLTIRSGVVSASNVHVEKSDLGDSDLENCMVTSIEGARFRDPSLPDYSEDQDLFLRIRSLNKYLDADEQKAAKELDRVED